MAEWFGSDPERYDRARGLDQLVTGGDVSRLTAVELEALLAAVGAAIDAIGGSVAMRYAAVAVTAARTAA